MFHLGWFLGDGFGIHPWMGDPWVGRNGWDWMKPDIYRDMASSLERAGFDFILIEDTCMVEDVYGGSMKTTLALGKMVPKNDPVPLVPMMMSTTNHIGVAVTLSTTFYHPYMAARTMATLDHLTEGRVGVNVVTSVSHRAAQNFGLDALPEHDLRYEMAHEWMDAVGALWDSWEPDAVLVDQENNVYADHTKVHVVDFEGKYYKTRGPLNTIPGPQRRPVVVQAGNSSPGRDLAAHYAESMLAHGTSVEQMKAFREDMHARMEKYGRKPDECKILFLVDPVLGETDAIAQQRREDARARAADPKYIDERLWGLTYVTGGEYDFAQADLDEPVPDVIGNGETSSLRTFYEASKGKTLREAIQSYRFGWGLGLCGSPDTVAAQMGEIMEEVGGDGFLVSSAVTRRSIAEVADGLAPALRKRGLIRDGYSHRTMRENLLEF